MNNFCIPTGLACVLALTKFWATVDVGWQFAWWPIDWSTWVIYYPALTNCLLAMTNCLLSSNCGHPQWSLIANLFRQRSPQLYPLWSLEVITTIMSVSLIVSTIIAGDVWSCSLPITRVVDRRAVQVLLTTFRWTISVNPLPAPVLPQISDVLRLFIIMDLRLSCLRFLVASSMAIGWYEPNSVRIINTPLANTPLSTSTNYHVPQVVLYPHH